MYGGGLPCTSKGTAGGGGGGRGPGTALRPRLSEPLVPFTLAPHPHHWLDHHGLLGDQELLLPPQFCAQGGREGGPECVLEPAARSAHSVRYHNTRRRCCPCSLPAPSHTRTPCRAPLPRRGGWRQLGGGQQRNSRATRWRALCAQERRAWPPSWGHRHPPHPAPSHLRQRFAGRGRRERL